MAPPRSRKQARAPEAPPSIALVLLATLFFLAHLRCALAIDMEFVQYEADFLAEDEGILGRRELKANHQSLENNAGMLVNRLPGDLPFFFQIENDTLFGSKTPSGAGLPSTPFQKVEYSGSDDSPSDNEIGDVSKRQATEDGVTVYLSINTCGQPVPNGTVPSPFPQLTMYVSMAEINPGPNTDEADLIVKPLVQGYAALNFTANKDVYVGVWAPNVTGYTEQWTYEVAASIDGFYHNYDQWNPTSGSSWNPLLFVDSDSASALLVTQNFTTANTSADVNEKWEESTNPFTLFAFKNASAIEGMSHSFCGINQAAAQLGKAPGNTTATITTRGTGSLPKGQFYITSLDSGTNYTVLMAMQGNSTMGGSGIVGGGGQVWQQRMFTTKSNNNCALVFDLPFCSEAAWSVPSNPSWNQSQLTSAYDNFTTTYYQNFNKSMQIYPCNTTDTARYSLATNCSNCFDAYKDWLCATTMPRCIDFAPVTVDAGTFGIVDSVGFPRNLAQPFPNGTLVTNTSLNTDLTRAGLNESWLDRMYSNQSRIPALIDQQIQPGPYLEVLPCEDLCFSLVRHCPAAIGFGCNSLPLLRRDYEEAGRCNSPGNVFIVSAASGLVPAWLSLVSLGLFALIHSVT